MAKAKNPAAAGGIHFNREAGDGALLVEAYGDGGFKLQERRVKGSLYVNGGGYWPVDAQNLEGMASVDLAALFGADPPELVLVGTGAKMAMLPKALKDALNTLGVSYDAMDTGAAARTYNVLHLEGRMVAALLLAVD